MADGSSRSRKQFAYDVFLSFRGEDVRKSFIDHLRMALNQAGITTFYDDTGLERGSEIQSELYQAIECSNMAIVTFSITYATSRWCLDELVKIMECRLHGLRALPVFYNVDPTDVRHQSGPYEEAFHKHEVMKHGVQRVNKWRQALTSAADLAGFGLQNQANGYEAQFIKHIVKEVVRKLDARQLDIPKYMVGAKSFLIQQISKWLANGSSQVEVGILYGPGGVGKTTSAKVVYNENYKRFESTSFLSEVRIANGKDIELIRLQNQLIRNITGYEEIRIESVPDGKQKIKKLIGNKTILVVLDDVDEVEHFHAMFDYPDWFFPGSKVLITSRNQNLLINEKSIARFQGCLLDEEKSIELFSYHAFGQAYPPQDFINISMLFIEYCGGLPLALEVLASSLKSIRFEMWESQYTKLQEYLDKKVLNVLKWSFDSLPDNTVKDIFLHIAFFMVGRDKDYALKILDGCDLYGKIGLENLIGKCLVHIDINSNTLMMHQLIQQMGYEVVRHKSPIELGRRSRLLGPKDAYEVLRKKTGTLSVKGLHLDIPDPLDGDISSEEPYAGHSAKRMRMTNIYANPSQQVPLHFRAINTNAFTKMKNLDLLLLENVQLDGGFKSFPKGIKWLLWLKCPLKEIPSDFDFDELVVLDMKRSCLVHAWKGLKYIGALKALNLSHSHYLRSTPDLSSAHMLEWISCKDCTSLVEVHESMGKLEYLTYLNLRGCINLVTLPEFNGNFKKVITKFLVKGCINLRNLPINRLGYVELLDLDGCRSLFKGSNICPSLPFNIFLPSLKNLCLTNCGIAGDAVMEMISLAPSLKILDLSENPIGAIMSNKNRRPCLMLTDLILRNCGISRFDDTTGMMSLAPSLKNMDLSNNPIFAISDRICQQLIHLILNNCPNLQSVSNIWDGCTLEAEHSHSLKRITSFDQETKIKKKQRHLIELEYGISATIERISEMNEDRASYLGFPNLNTFDSLRMDRSCFGRGIYKAGVYIVILRGDYVAKWFPTLITCTRGDCVSSVSYWVPYFHPDNERSIRAVNVGFWSRDFANLTIENVSRKWSWLYSIPYSPAANSKKNTWLTHWCVTEHRQIRPGDKLEIRISGRDLKYIGVQVIYKEEEDQIDGERAETDEDSDDLSKFINSSNMSTSQDEDDSATNVTVWYNNTFRSTDLSLYYDKLAERRWWGDECMHYRMCYPLGLWHFEAIHKNGEGAETDEDSDDLGGEEYVSAAAASSTCMNILGLGDDKEDNCGAIGGLESLLNDCVNDEDTTTSAKS